MSWRVMGPGLPSPMDAAVKLDGGDDFGGGAGEEHFVGVVDVVQGDDRLGDA